MRFGGFVFFIRLHEIYNLKTNPDPKVSALERGRKIVPIQRWAWRKFAVPVSGITTIDVGLLTAGAMGERARYSVPPLLIFFSPLVAPVARAHFCAVR